MGMGSCMRLGALDSLRQDFTVVTSEVGPSFFLLQWCLTTCSNRTPMSSSTTSSIPLQTCWLVSGAAPGMFYSLVLSLVWVRALVAERKAAGEPPGPTWVHEIFQGMLTNETRCLCCETVRSKDENFLDLSVDIEQNTSLTHCLR